MIFFVLFFFAIYRTAAMGPFHGMSLNANANDAAFILSTSGEYIEPNASILHTNCVSHRKFDANNGRSDRSIKRAESISLSDLPNSRRRKFNGIRPAAAYFCRKSTVSGINPPPLGLSFDTAVTKTDVSPIRHSAAPLANRAYFPDDKLIDRLQKKLNWNYITLKSHTTQNAYPLANRISSSNGFDLLVKYLLQYLVSMNFLLCNRDKLMRKPNAATHI